MPSFSERVTSARLFYAENGVDTLPLLAGSKVCRVKNWQIISPEEAWRYAPSDSNIGIRCGGARHLAVIDCDDKNQPGTFNNVMNFLAGLGIDVSTLLIVQTASGIGRHIYFTLKGYIPGNSSKLSPQIGSGEFRYGKGAYVLAPPSFIEGYGGYTWLQGDVSNLPVVEYSFVTGLLDHPNTVEAEKETRKDTRYTNFTRNQKSMLNGIGVDKYKSRSEYEYAFMVSLVNKDRDWNEIVDIFDRYPCGGKFSEINSKNRKQACHYLKRSYDKAFHWAKTNTSVGRQCALDAEAWAMARPWPGRTGAYDRDAYFAHVKIAKTSGRLIYQASCRTISEQSNMPSATAARATKRLVDAGYLEVIRPGIGNYATEYRLVISETLPHPPVVRKCLISNIEHDVFCRKGLGKSSKLIWEVLSEGPKTPKELEIETGRKLPTIRKWLKIMNELFDGKSEKPMVNESEGKWYGNQDISLESISEFLGVNGVMEKREKRHQEERAIHNSAFMRK